MLYTVICRAALKPSALSQLADRETYLNIASTSELPGGRMRHYLMIEASTTAAARKAAARALDAVGATDYELEVRGAPVPV
jgi:hypothetical protein